MEFPLDQKLIEFSFDEENITEEEEPPRRKEKGGLITIPFIIANEAFEKVASYGLMPNMIKYLMEDYRMSVTRGTNILYFWSASTNFLPVVGAFFSDSHFGRFWTIGFGSIASLLGMVLLWLTSMISQTKPPPCKPSVTNSCQLVTAFHLAFLCFSFGFISIGAGGIRPCSLAFGADQLDKRGNPNNNERLLESFFNWYYASASVSAMIAFTAIVYIQEHWGWRVGFGVPAILMLFSALLFFMASPFYIKVKPNKNLFKGFAQVLVATLKNRNLAISPHKYHNNKGSSTIVGPTHKLRFLNKACIIKNPEQELTPDGSASNPWSLCPVEQVEELKSLIKVIPLWSTGIMMAVNMSQSSFQVLQVNTMNRKITSKFEIPAGSFGMFTILALILWIAIYDRVIIPLVSKLIGRPAHLGVKQRMGIGILFSCIAMAASATVETVRRRTAIREGFSDDPHRVVGMSAFWLLPQLCFSGIAEAFNAIGQFQFYYSEFPKTMSSIAAALFGLGMAVANLLASLILNIVDDFSKRGGKESWVSSNINKGHYDYYYWLLAILSLVNLAYFLICSWGYGPCQEENSRFIDKKQRDERRRRVLLDV